MWKEIFKLTHYLETTGNKAIVEMLVADSPDDATEFVSLRLCVETDSFLPVARVQAKALRQARKLVAELYTDLEVRLDGDY